MGKSVTATLMGILVQQGVYDLWQPAPIPEWQGAGRSAREDPHRRPHAHVERAAHQRAAGSRLRSRRGGLSRPRLSLHGRRRLLSLRGDAAAAMAAGHGGSLSQHRSGADQLSRCGSAVEKRGEEYLSFPQRALFDKIGIRTMVIETDPYGNFLDAGLRAGVGARLGAARQSLSSGRRLERRADSARGVRRSS